MAGYLLVGQIQLGISPFLTELPPELIGAAGAVVQNNRRLEPKTWHKLSHCMRIHKNLRAAAVLLANDPKWDIRFASGSIKAIKNPHASQFRYLIRFP